jgi:hypothetical protein
VKYFNTAGPCSPELHYMLPPGPRLPEARRLIEQGQYFVIHAPRQSGKTTVLHALARDLSAVGDRVALVVSCGAATVTKDDYGAAEQVVLPPSAQRRSGMGSEMSCCHPIRGPMRRQEHG